MSIAIAENRGIDEDIFNKIITVYSRQPCHQTIGLVITYLGKGTAGMKIVPELQFTTEGGRVHGGIIATLADIVMGAAVTTNGLIYRTAEMKINYLVPVFEEVELIAEAKVVHPGKPLLSLRPICLTMRANWRPNVQALTFATKRPQKCFRM